MDRVLTEDSDQRPSQDESGKSKHVTESDAAVGPRLRGLDVPTDVVSENWIAIDNSTSESPENELNRARLARFRKDFEKELLCALRESDFEYGLRTLADGFIEERLAENETVVREWLNDLFIKNFEDTAVATRILRLIAHLDYEDIYPQGPTMALAALAHSSAEVRECGIRALENWGTRDSLRILETVRCHEPWLQKYVSRVVSDLRNRYLHVVSR